MFYFKIIPLELRENYQPNDPDAATNSILSTSTTNLHNVEEQLSVDLSMASVGLRGPLIKHRYHSHPETKNPLTDTLSQIRIDANIGSQKTNRWINSPTWQQEISAALLPDGATKLKYDGVLDIAHAHYNWLKDQPNFMTPKGACLVAAMWDPDNKIVYASSIPLGPRKAIMAKESAENVAAPLWYNQVKRFIEPYPALPTVNPFHAEDGVYFNFEMTKGTKTVNGKFPADAIIAVWGKCKNDKTDREINLCSDLYYKKSYLPRVAYELGVDYSRTVKEQPPQAQEDNSHDEKKLTCDGPSGALEFQTTAEDDVTVTYSYTYYIEGSPHSEVLAYEAFTVTNLAEVSGSRTAIIYETTDSDDHPTTIVAFDTPAAPASLTTAAPPSCSLQEADPVQGIYAAYCICDQSSQPEVRPSMVGTVTRTELYTKVFNTLETLCLTVTQTASMAYCSLDSVIIEDVPYVDANFLVEGELVVSVESNAYNATSLRDAMIKKRQLLLKEDFVQRLSVPLGTVPAMDEAQPLLGPNHEPQQQHTETHTLVDFDPNGDPENPMDWPKAYKMGVVALLALMAFTVTFTCIGIVPVANQIVFDLEGKESKSASILLVTVWELGEAAGPLLIAPLSEIYGRYPTFNVANCIFILGVILAALSRSVNLLIFARFLTGFAVASNVLNPAIIGDIFPSESRGSGMSLVMLAPLIGGAVGPAISGVIAESLGWRRILWMSAVLAILCEVTFFILLRETYKVPILQRRAARLRKETNDESLKSAWDVETAGMTLWSALRSSLMRPLHVMLDSGVLQIMSFYGGLMFTLFYMIATTLPEMLTEIYHFSPAQTGSSFLSFSIGASCGIVVCNIYLDHVYVTLSKSRGVAAHPEYRLPFMVIGAVFMPAIVAFYGWVPYAHWPVSLLLFSVGLTGFFLLFITISLASYIVDAFGLYSASAMTGVLIARCLAGTLLPLAIPPLTGALGLGYGFLVLAAICAVLIPLPLIVIRYGPHWRQNSAYTRNE
ncbi:hypothetical protein B7463_g8505, partial [Scytalidium lignicola]